MKGIEEGIVHQIKNLCFILLIIPLSVLNSAALV